MSNLVKYETDRGEVILSPEVVKKLIAGDPNKVTDEEVMLFINLCRYQRLNPFLREVYLIKYSDNAPAAMVVGKDVFIKRAANHPDCAGWQAGVVVEKDGQLIEREGSLVLKDEILVGGWSKVYRKSWKEPLKMTVSLSEYERRDKQGNLQRAWATMAATMIRKVALVHGLREAFPEDLEALYVPEEFGLAADDLPKNTIEVEVYEEHQKLSENRPLENQQDKSDGNGREDQYTKFWREARGLGFTPKEVFEIAGVQEFTGYTKAQLDIVLAKLREEARKRGKLL